MLAPGGGGGGDHGGRLRRRHAERRRQQGRRRRRRGRRHRRWRRAGPLDALPRLEALPSGDRSTIALTAEVFAHSADTLYVLDPLTKRVTTIGKFDCVGTPTAPGSMVDLAVDKSGRMTGSGAVPDPTLGLGGALYTIDKSTARCTMLSRTTGGPLTSLSYVPVGTVLPNAEALVGYEDNRYVRVDPTTGAVALIGMLNVGAASQGTRWISSGDIVSIEGGGTYLTVTGRADDGHNRIVEVNPTTGALTRIIGPTDVEAVLGLGYWAGVAYGFSLAGQLMQIDLASGSTTNIPIPDAPTTLEFFGAGTTTAAPVVP